MTFLFSDSVFNCLYPGSAAILVAISAGETPALPGGSGGNSKTLSCSSMLDVSVSDLSAKMMLRTVKTMQHLATG